MKAPVSRVFLTRAGKGLRVVGLISYAAGSAVNIAGSLERDFALQLTGVILAVSILSALAYLYWSRPLTVKLTPEWIKVGRTRIPLREVSSVEAIPSWVGPGRSKTFHVRIRLSEGGEVTVRDVIHGSEIGELVKRFLVDYSSDP